MALNAEEVIAENAKARTEVLAALMQVPPSAREQVWFGEWSLADIVAHLAGAQDGYAEALESVARGGPPVITGWEPGPPHEWNGATVAARRDRTWEQRLADLASAQRRHEAAVRALPAERFEDRRLVGLASNPARHERQHIQAVFTWLQGGG